MANTIAAEHGRRLIGVLEDLVKSDRLTLKELAAAGGMVTAEGVPNTAQASRILRDGQMPSAGVLLAMFNRLESPACRAMLRSLLGSTDEHGPTDRRAIIARAVALLGDDRHGFNGPLAQFISRCACDCLVKLAWLLKFGEACEGHGAEASARRLEAIGMLRALRQMIDAMGAAIDELQAESDAWRPARRPPVGRAPACGTLQLTEP